MNKLQMAHEYVIALIGCNDNRTMEELIILGWKYADAMQAEADKREQQKQGKLKQDQQNHHDDLVSIGLEEWQPDWSQAPAWANWYAYCDKSNCGIWYDFEPHIHNGSWFGNRCLYTGKFEYQGDWRNSLRKRPE